MQIFSGFVITGHVRGELTESGRQGSGLQVTENGVNSNDCNIHFGRTQEFHL